MKFVKQLLLPVLISMAICLNAQDNVITLVPSDRTFSLPDSIILVKKAQTVDQALSRYVDELIYQNYLEASVDSIQVDSIGNIPKKIAYIFVGPKYDFDQLAYDSTNIKLFKKWHVNPPLNSREYLKLRKTISSYHANNGYPFAKLTLKNFSINNQKVFGQLSLDSGPRIIIDSLNIIGNLNIRTTYLEKYLGIQQGQLYDHSKVIRLGELLQKLTFLDQGKEPDITFFNNYSTINLYLNTKNSSRFDLLFGVIPTNSIEGRQLFLSLDFTAELLNKLGYGEYLFVDFERLRPEQQKFEFQFNYPYIFNLPYALDFDFSIFRNSLEYQTFNSNIGMEYLVNSHIRIKAGWDIESSNIVEIDTAMLFQTKELPEDLDVKQNGLSIETSINRLDYKFNPRRGFSLYLKAIAGRRTIQRNTSIINLKDDQTNFINSYDSLQLSSFRYELVSGFSNFYPLAQRGSLGFHVKTGWRYSNSGLLRNEKYQIGGNKLMRGFDEASFFTPFYVITTFEYRLLLSNNSYFSVPFIDVGFFEDTKDHSTLAIGIGSSLGVETKAGLFNFSVAVGRTKEVGFDFRRPKAHFGFVSLF